MKKRVQESAVLAKAGSAKDGRSGKKARKTSFGQQQQSLKDDHLLRSPAPGGSQRPSVIEKESLIEIDRKNDTFYGTDAGTVTEGGQQQSTAGGVGTTVMSESEQVDILLDRYIEIESNKRMINENVFWLCLTFKVSPMEDKVSTRFVWSKDVEIVSKDEPEKK